jgi:predicted Zn finger-like uncharacterized protein
VADIFISYRRADKAHAEKLVRLLTGEGWTVWWDQHLRAGDTFDDVIDKALGEARCVIVLWSRQSVDSHWVRAEAAEGQSRKVLVPVLLDDARVPLEFRRLQMVSFANSAMSTAPERQLIDAVHSILERTPAGLMRVTCPACKTENEVSPDQSGQLVRCSHCKEPLIARPAKPKSVFRSKSVAARKRRTRVPIVGVCVVMLSAVGLWISFRPAAGGAPGEGNDSAAALSGDAGGAGASLSPSARDAASSVAATSAAAEKAAHESEINRLHGLMGKPTEAKVSATFDERLAWASEILVKHDSHDQFTIDTLQTMSAAETDESRRARLDDVKRWIGKSTGDAARFATLSREAAAETTARDEKGLRATRDAMQKILKGAHEIADIERTLQDWDVYHSKVEELLPKLQSGNPVELESALSQAADLRKNDALLAKSNHLDDSVVSKSSTRLQELQKAREEAFNALGVEEGNVATVADAVSCITKLQGLLAQCAPEKQDSIAAKHCAVLDGRRTVAKRAVTDWSKAFKAVQAVDEARPALSSSLSALGICLDGFSADAEDILQRPLPGSAEDKEFATRVTDLATLLPDEAHVARHAKLFEVAEALCNHFDVKVAKVEEARAQFARLNTNFPVLLKGPIGTFIETLRNACKKTIAAEDARIESVLDQTAREMEIPDLDSARAGLMELLTVCDQESDLGIRIQVRLAQCSYLKEQAKFDHLEAEGLKGALDRCIGEFDALKDKKSTRDSNGTPARPHVTLTKPFVMMRLVELYMDRAAWNLNRYRERNVNTYLDSYKDDCKSADEIYHKLQSDFPTESDGKDSYLDQAKQLKGRWNGALKSLSK